MHIIVFLGPSFPLDEAKAILPDAEFMPPAQQADILSVVHNYRPDVIALIDGVFSQSLSVWHKEILYALEHGVQVYGAGSMGALRAAETASFGTIGVGWVYEQFAAGLLSDDDEVALLHGGADTGYYQASQPMVNLRRTFSLAMEKGVIDEPLHDRLIELGKGIFYPERTAQAILEQARLEGQDKDALRVLADFCERSYVDIKARDARLLLETLKDLPESSPKPEVGFSLTRSHLMATMYDRDRWVDRKGERVRLYEIAEYAALHMPEFNELNFAALNRSLVQVMADMLEIEVTEQHLAHERLRLRRRLGLKDEQGLEDWRKANNLSAIDLDELIREVAVCRRMQYWLLNTSKVMEGSTKIVLNELRLRDKYGQYADLAAEQAAVAENRPERFMESDVHEVDMTELIKEHLKRNPLRHGRPV